MFPLKDSVRTCGVPVVTLLLVLINVICFIGELFVSDQQSTVFLRTFAVIPATFVSRFSLAQFGHITSSMFLHAGFGHLLGNMWFLWIFGDGLEGRIGHYRYLALYLVAGIIAAIVQILFDFKSTIPLLGASGAISGLLGAYFFLFPRATVSVLMLMGIFSRVIEIPASLFLGFWFIMQLFSGVFSFSPALSEAPGIAFWAHSAGFLVGFLAAKFVLPRSDDDRTDLMQDSTFNQHASDSI